MRGDIAQMGERSVRNAEVGGSSPPVSTTQPPHVTERGTVMQLRPKQPAAKGSDKLFTGDVWIEQIAPGEAPPHTRVAAVRFAPGARTAWHSHLLGQTLYVTEGHGLTQTRGGPIEQLRAGDVTQTPAGELHWHGASPDHFMTHLSITEHHESQDGQPDTDWGAHVTDAEYRGAPD